MGIGEEVTTSGEGQKGMARGTALEQTEFMLEMGPLGLERGGSHINLRILFPYIWMLVIASFAGLLIHKFSGAAIWPLRG